MSGPIEVGKWAIPYRGCAYCQRPFPGPLRPFIVTEIYKASGDVADCCGTPLGDEIAYATGYWPKGEGIALLLLKRIDDPPPAESIETEEREGATA